MQQDNRTSKVDLDQVQSLPHLLLYCSSMRCSALSQSLYHDA